MGKRQSDVPFERVVISDVDGHASSNELWAVAVQHVKKWEGGYIEIPHGPSPINEFDNPWLFPIMYSTLYPYGLGEFEDKARSSCISLKAHAKHLFSLTDHHFQEHPSFMFTAFNMLQRRAVVKRVYSHLYGHVDPVGPGSHIGDISWLVTIVYKIPHTSKIEYLLYS
jgi:hypothetical protein